MRKQTMQGNIYLVYFILFYLKVPAGQALAPDFYRNQLHFGCGINYKYNGKLYHNLDRVWVAHRVVIPKIQDLDRLPNFPDELNCTPQPRKHLPHLNLNKQALVQVLCKMAAPHLKMLRQQAYYLKRNVKSLVKDDCIMPCTVYILFHILDIKENKRDLLTLPQGHCRTMIP